MMPDVALCESPYEAAEGADAVVLVTEWDALRALDLKRLAGTMRGKVLVDLRNVYPPEEVEERGAGMARVSAGPRRDALWQRRLKNDPSDWRAAAAGRASRRARPRPSRRRSPIIELRKADGSVVARAMLYPGRGGAIEVRVQAAGLAPGQYGAHIHAVGRCDGPDFESAGPHWNPANRQHGRLNPAGPHLGDLPNLEVAADGAGRLEFAIPGATLRGGEGAIVDADGAALVIHAAPDDYRTDPSGNSGARIACGVLRLDRLARRRGRARPWWLRASRCGGSRSTGRAGSGPA